MTPTDAAVRQLVIDGVKESVSLSAGAGSGKTTVLTERLVNVLASGVAPDRIAAITFTEKAAGELQRRVRDALETRFKSSGSEVARMQLERYHELTLSTIHSFCRRLLAMEPLASRWSPGTEVSASEVPGVGVALAAWRRRWFEEDELRVALFDDRLSDTALRSGVMALIDHRDLEPLVADVGLDWERAHFELRAIYREFEDALAGCMEPETCKLVAANMPLHRALRSWSAAVVGEATVAALLGEEKGKRGGGKARDWPDDGKARFVAVLNKFDEWRERSFGHAHRDLVLSLREDVVPKLLEARVKSATADFQDLLFRAADLLGTDEVRSRIAQRYDALLIDEVQDTDPIQAEVAVLLARDPATAGDWLSAPPRPGHLFAVGDPKQSIYRFRRADVSVWSDLQAVIAKHGRLEKLAQNYRSVRGLVGWLNHVFAELPTFEPQNAHRGEAALDPVVVINSDEEAQFEHALAHLFELKASGAKVADPNTNELRPMRWGDVMVLLPRWKSAEDIASRFGRAGIEATVEGGGTFFHGEEVRLCVSALRALDEPADAEATVHVLGGLFGYTLEQLAEHVAAGGGWRYTITQQPAGPVADSLAFLRDLRLERRESWVPVLDRLLEHTRATAVWSLLPDGHARLANLDKLRHLCRELELTSRSPTQVVTRLVDLQWEDGEDDLSLLEPDSDSVRITSIFKAKGLEAPIVVLLDSQRSKRAPSVVFNRQAREVAIKMGSDFAPPGWRQIADMEAVEQQEERRRWIYVACTRARDQLVIVDYEKANLLDFVRGRGWDPEGDARQTVGDVEVVVRPGGELAEAPTSRETFPGLDGLVDGLLDAPPGRGDPVGEDNARERTARLRNSVKQCTRWRSVGELVSGARAPATGSGVGSIGGTVVHRVMQELDLTRPRAELVEDVPALVSTFAAELELEPERIPVCCDVVRRMLGHPVIARAAAAPERWSEVPFAFHARGGVITGTIDLCFPEDETRRRWVVVDWKSDLPPEGHPQRETYERQIATYAKALLATVSPCEEVESILVGPAAELPPPTASEQALEEVDDELRPGLELLLARGAPVPQVGVDIGEPVIATVELVWETEQVALGLDLLDDEAAALEAAGWLLVRVDRSTVGWPRRALDELLDRFGLAHSTEVDADDASSSVNSATLKGEAN